MAVLPSGMKTKRPRVEARIRRLIAKLRRRENEYRSEMVASSSTPLNRARYEGICIGSRWAAEDLEKLLA